MKLFYSPGACSLASHIIATETGLTFDLVKVNLSTHTTESGEDFYAINPKGYIPALQLDNSEVLTEGVAILQYLADQKPELNLIPKAGTFERYRTQEWLTFISSEVHKAFSPLWAKDVSTEVRTETVGKLNKRFDYINKHLSGKKFIQGDRFSVVDAYLFTILNWTSMLNVDLSSYPELQNFMKRVSEMDSVKTAMTKEGLLG